MPQWPTSSSPFPPFQACRASVPYAALPFHPHRGSPSLQLRLGGMRAPPAYPPGLHRAPSHGGHAGIVSVISTPQRRKIPPFPLLRNNARGVTPHPAGKAVYPAQGKKSCAGLTAAACLQPSRHFPAFSCRKKIAPCLPKRLLPALFFGLLPGKKDNLGQTACVRPCSGKRPDYARDNATTWQRKPLLPREIGKTCPPGDDPRQKNLPRPGEGKYIHPAMPAGKDKKYPAGSARFPEEGKNIQTEAGCLRIQTKKAPCRLCPSRRMWL